jgi:hypothetical protein
VIRLRQGAESGCLLGVLVQLAGESIGRDCTNVAGAPDERGTGGQVQSEVLGCVLAEAHLRAAREGNLVKSIRGSSQHIFGQFEQFQRRTDEKQWDRQRPKGRPRHAALGVHGVERGARAEHEFGQGRIRRADAQEASATPDGLAGNAECFLRVARAGHRNHEVERTHPTGQRVAANSRNRYGATVSDDRTENITTDTRATHSGNYDRTRPTVDRHPCQYFLVGSGDGKAHLSPGRGSGAQHLTGVSCLECRRIREYCVIDHFRLPAWLIEPRRRVGLESRCGRDSAARIPCTPVRLRLRPNCRDRKGRPGWLAVQSQVPLCQLPSLIKCSTLSRTSAIVSAVSDSTLRRSRGSVLLARRLNHQASAETVSPSRSSSVTPGRPM